MGSEIPWSEVESGQEVVVTGQVVKVKEMQPEGLG